MSQKLLAKFISQGRFRESYFQVWMEGCPDVVVDCTDVEAWGKPYTEQYGSITPCALQFIVTRCADIYGKDSKEMEGIPEGVIPKGLDTGAVFLVKSKNGLSHLVDASELEVVNVNL